jgi:two-component system, OmpR family, response regulator QseB
MRILLVEDDKMIGGAVQTGLKRQGFTVDWVQDGLAARSALKTETFELVLLDLGLPGMDGLQLLKSMRTAGDRVPVLILTARDSVTDRIKGLDAGADDYLVKPFDLDELAARVRAVARRNLGRAEPIVEHLGVTLDPANHAATCDGEAVNLSQREFALLAALLERPGHVLSRATLEERLYGWGEEVESNAIEVHIHNLRKKLKPTYIQNVRGVGYRVRSGK